MDQTSRSRKKMEVVLIGILVLTWLAALVFYWSVAPESNRHTLANFILSYLVLWGVVFLWSNATKSEKAKRFFLTSASVALIVGLFEILALTQIVDFRSTFNTPFKEPWRHPDNPLDPKLLHNHKPYLRFRWSGIEYRYDQHGLRNESDLETADVVVIGDSFIEGWGVSATDLVTSHLAKQLGVTVANLGQSWYGPQQELELLRRYGMPLRPKDCVWTFFEGNDLYDVHRYKEATQDWENFSKKLHSFRQRSLTKNLLLAVRRLLDSAHHHRSDSAAGPKDISGIFEASSGGKTRLYFWYKGLHLSPFDNEALQELRSSLRQAHELCRNQGANFLVVFIPTKYRVYNSFTEFDAYSKPRYWVINSLPERVEAIVREDLSDGQFLDLTPALREQARNGSLVYFPDDTHWSPDGHRVAAIAIGDFLTRWKRNSVPVPSR
jgi:hypothetical protein